MIENEEGKEMQIAEKRSVRIPPPRLRTKQMNSLGSKVNS